MASTYIVKIIKLLSRIVRYQQFYAILAIIGLLLYVNTLSNRAIPVTHYSHVPGRKEYLVWSENCQMLNMDPFTPDLMKHFYRYKYKACTYIKPLTYLDYNETEESYVMLIDHNAIPYYSKTGIITCCYQVIKRNYTKHLADFEVGLTNCIPFKNKTKLSPTIDNILVRCRGKIKQIYVNAHAMIPKRPEILQRQSVFQATNSKDHPPSVLMLGIDSVSKFNLIRAMPKTAQYLYDNDWFEMSGYNKINDNTVPNLMAILTGNNLTTVNKICPSKDVGGLNKCNFIWDTYQRLGYVTAYAEDDCYINTFNYAQWGFEKTPVDYYLRPFLLAAEKHLSIKIRTKLVFCLGYKHSAEHVYDYAIELATRYKNTPYFGLFWANTFSHNSLSDPTTMDDRILDYMKQFSNIGNNTIVILFSDHGMRIGPTRRTNIGLYEDRLPFLFIWIPPYIRESYGDIVVALKINKNRLTNPYDMYMTLKHVLKLKKNTAINAELQEPAAACARCQTLFEEVPYNRSCEEISIPDHDCSCLPYQSIYKDSRLIYEMTQSVVDYMNNYLRNYQNGSLIKKCAQLSILNVEKAAAVLNLFPQEQKRQNDPNKYRLTFYTKPNKGLFEATIRYNSKSKAIDIAGDISRLNLYATDSECVSDRIAKKFCSCFRK